MLNHIKIICVFFMLLFSFNVIADEEKRNKISLTTFSWHQDRSKNYDEENFGITYQHKFDNNHNFVAAYFKNSFSRYVPTAGYGYTVYKKGELEIMPWIGITNDYLDDSRGITPFGSIRISYSYFNLEVVPAVVYTLSINILQF